MHNSAWGAALVGFLLYFMHEGKTSNSYFSFIMYIICFTPFKYLTFRHIVVYYNLK